MHYEHRVTTLDDAISVCRFRARWRGRIGRVRLTEDIDKAAFREKVREHVLK